MKLPALKELIDERKETAIQSLSENYAKNKLPLEEYERLVEYIHKIESERELVVVERIVAEFGDGQTQDDDEDDDQDYFPVHDRHKNSKVSVLSSRTFQGTLDTRAQYLSILGSTRIKIRKSDLKKKRNKLNVLVILGDCVIMVENGIRVINHAVPILGSAGVSQNIEKQEKGAALELVISGAALLGDISVKLLKE